MSEHTFPISYHLGRLTEISSFTSYVLAESTACFNEKERNAFVEAGYKLSRAIEVRLTNLTKAYKEKGE